MEKELARVRGDGGRQRTGLTMQRRAEIAALQKERVRKVVVSTSGKSSRCLRLWR